MIRFSQRNSLLLTLFFGLCVTLLYLVPLGSYPLMEPDEGRYHEIPREMVMTGDFVTPKLNGVEYFEKPALSYWITAGAFKVFGETEWAGRFWPALSALLGVAVTGLLGKRIYGFKAGILAAVITATSLLYLAVGSINILDMPLSLFLTMTMASFHLAHRGNRKWYLAFYASMALGLLTKGLVALVLPGGIILCYIVLTRQWRLIIDSLYWPGIMLFSAIAMPWFIMVCRTNPDFFNFFFIREHFLRYATKMHNRYEPFWFFVPMVIAGLFPWTGFLPGLFVRNGVIRSPESEQQKQDGWYLLLWSSFILFFFSLSDSKLIPYVVPCLPPLAILLGASLERSVVQRHWLGKGLTVTTTIWMLFVVALFVYSFFGKDIDITGVPVLALGLAAPLVAGSVLIWYLSHTEQFRAALLALCVTAFSFIASTQGLLPYVASQRSALPVARELEKILEPDDVLVNANDYLQGLPFYLKRRVLLVDYLGELEFGSQHESGKGWFLTGAEFLPRWQSGDESFVLVARSRDFDQKYPEMAASATRRIDVGKYVIVTNQKEPRQ